MVDLDSSELAPPHAPISAITGRPKTPPSNRVVPVPVHHNTPRHSRVTDSSVHAQATMKEHRASILSDIHEIPAVSFEDFKHFLPNVVDATQVDRIAARLRDNSFLLPNGRWALFPNDPAEASGEDKTFKHLETIAAAIVNEAAVLLKRTPTAIMQTKPRQAAISEGRNGQFISDGHYALCNSLGAKVVRNETATTYEGFCQYDNNRKVALACDRPEIEEYKPKDRWEDENDNNKKILGNAAQMLYADPCRRFMFGTTIANTTTRLWYFSRAVILVSNPFNFITEHKYFIHYVISMSFGSLRELGYDTSVVRVAIPIGSCKYRIQYDYLIGGKKYRTVECLSSFRASGIVSRATRVWKVLRLDDRREFALKDVWVPLAAETEAEIQHRIFRLIEEKDPAAKADPSLYKKYFMDISACEVVRTDGGEDMVPALDSPYTNYSVQRPYRSSASLTKTSALSHTAAPVGGAIAGDNQLYAGPERLYAGRKHVRVLFSEVGIPLDKVDDQGMLFSGLLHAFKGLRYLYKSGHVHRDISAGNILLCNNNQAKISDLEYVKRFLSTEPKSDPKTGTPIFMAIEVQASKYLFHRSESRSALGDNPQARVRLSLQELREMRLQREKPLQTKHFLHNFLHDAESIWWIGAHSLFSTLPLSSPATEAGIAQKNAFRDLFPHQATGSQGRSMFFKEQETYDSVAKSSLPEEYERAAFLLDDCRILLVDCYRSVEAEEDFPTPEHFAKFFNSDSFDIYLEALAQSDVGKIQPWKNLDSVKEAVEEEEIDWAVTGLEEINYADYGSPEADVDNSGDYVASKRKRSANKAGAPVDQDRITKLPRRSSRIRAIVQDKTVEHQSPKTTATKQRSTRSTRGSGRTSRGGKKSKH